MTKITIEEISECWDQWIHGPDMITKDMKPPVNFLGGVKDHKKKFIETVKAYIEEKSKNKMSSIEKYDIIRKEWVITNVQCTCEAGCDVCNGTRKIIKYVKKNRPKQEG